MYYRPAEWRKNKTIWLAWPDDRELWREDLAPAQDEFIALVQALSHEQVMIVVPNIAEQKVVQKKLGATASVEFTMLPYGDIWLRDTFPIFVIDDNGTTAAVLPRFNGWGQKYQFADDMVLSKTVAKQLGVPHERSNIIFEGGAIECDGAGTLLTTEQCLLNHNRNPSVSKEQIEQNSRGCSALKKWCG